MKIVTNTTGTAIDLAKVGVTLLPSTAFTIQPAQYPFWAQYSTAGSQIATLVASGDILVSDGLSPALDATLGIALLRGDIARDIAFDARINGFVSTEVQSAIEEAGGQSLVLFTCDAGLAVGDLVVASTAVDGKAVGITDNLYPYVVVGVAAVKPTTTSVRVRMLGRQSGFSGLTRGATVFVSPSGLPSTSVPATGNIQVLGVAVSATEILFNIKFDKLVRN